MRDEQIIERVLKGSIDEYQELMRRYQDGFYRLAYRITGRHEDAEDAVLEAFTTAYSKLADCRDRSKFLPWVRRILVNICLRRFGREIPVEEVESIGGLVAADNPVEEEALRKAQANEIRDAVDELPPAYRTVIVLRYEEGLELREIAELLGEQPGAIYTRLHRARKLLATRLEVMINEMC